MGREEFFLCPEGNKLNRSIPILIVYDNLTAIDVYPKDILGVRYDLRAAFETPSTSNVLGVEQSLFTILSSKPQMLEPALALVDKEFETDAGKIDLLFKDNKGVFLAVEVKEDANQKPWVRFSSSLTG